VTLRIAALTVVRDEPVMLPRWIDHYARQVGGAEHLVVVDDSTSDGSTDDLPCPVIRIPPLKKTFDSSRVRLVSGIAAGLLESYDAVVFTDADEFLVADPTRYATLRDLVADRPAAKAIGAVGLNVIHDARTEPPLDPGRPILAQRRLAKFVPLMCKPSIKTVTAAWAAASHGVRAPYVVDPELFMFHAKFADRDGLLASAARRRSLDRAPQSSWSRTGDEMVDLLDEITRDIPADLAEFRPDPAALARVVEQKENGTYRSAGDFQLGSMRKRPLRLIPERFRDTV
jgi:hypothetical protein